MAIHLKADGSETEVQPANGKKFSLKEMQSFVGGYVQVVKAKDGRDILTDEDGKMKGLPINEAACELSIHGFADPIVGDVLVCKRREI